MFTASVRLHHASFGTTSPTFGIPENLAGEGFDGIWCREPFLFQSLGCFDSVRVVGCGFGRLLL